MIFDKLSMFANGTTVAKTASGSTNSKVIDLRKCNVIDDCLKIYGQIVGTANSAGSVTTKVQTSDDGSTWTDIESQTQSGNRLIATRIPYGHKRFLRLVFAVGTTALDADVKVTAGLVDNFDQEDVPALQKYPPLEDLAPKGDAVNA